MAFREKYMNGHQRMNCNNFCDLLTFTNRPKSICPVLLFMSKYSIIPISQCITINIIKCQHAYTSYQNGKYGTKQVWFTKHYIQLKISQGYWDMIAYIHVNGYTIKVKRNEQYFWGPKIFTKLKKIQTWNRINYRVKHFKFPISLTHFE